MRTLESLVLDVKTNPLTDITDFPNRCYLETNKSPSLRIMPVGSFKSGLHLYRSAVIISVNC